MLALLCNHVMFGDGTPCVSQARVTSLPAPTIWSSGPREINRVSAKKHEQSGRQEKRKTSNGFWSCSRGLQRVHSMLTAKKYFRLDETLDQQKIFSPNLQFFLQENIKLTLAVGHPERGSSSFSSGGGGVRKEALFSYLSLMFQR